MRQRPEAFPLVQHENTAYGFRRNLLALKPLGVALSAAGLLFDAGWSVAVDATPAVAVLGAAHGLLLVTWLTVVRQDWVREQGERNADQLFGALLSPAASDAA